MIALVPLCDVAASKSVMFPTAPTRSVDEARSTSMKPFIRWLDEARNRLKMDTMFSHVVVLNKSMMAASATIQHFDAVQIYHCYRPKSTGQRHRLLQQQQEQDCQNALQQATQCALRQVKQARQVK